MMRILQINTVYKTGSTGKMVYNLHTMLLKDGHLSVVCYGRGKAADESTYKLNTEAGFRLHALITRITGITGVSSNYATNKLIRYIKKFNPDIVHLHNLHGYYINIYRIMNVLKKLNIKTIWTFHDDFMITGRCAGYYLCDKWSSGCGNCRYLNQYPASWFLDFSSCQYKYKKSAFHDFSNLIIVTPSEWLANRVRNSYLKDKKIQVIRNGIDTVNTFYPRESAALRNKHQIGANEKIILAVAPDFSNERKGGKYILQLAEKLGGNSDIKVIVVGYSGETAGLPKNLIAVGNLSDQSELSGYYSLADVFVITSQCENFPTVCLEALACGTPAAGFDRGGTKETVPPGLGYFVEYGDVEELKNAVLKLMNETDCELGKKCVEYAKSNYSVEKMYLEYLNLYNQNK